ncbi:MAG: LysE family transporter [Planctomycetes bacterium]|nr:LysE family transporter [Planctomycetota bacterium]
MEPFLKGLFIQGVIVGFAIAAPVGPIGVLCIGRTLAHGRLRGLATGMGAALADSLYGGVAGFGLNVVANAMLQQIIWIRLFGGCLLCFMGYKMLRTKVADQKSDEPTTSIAGSFASAFILTLTNPMTLLAFAAIFAGLRLPELRNHIEDVWLLVLGVFSGSALWWVFLSLGMGVFRKSFTPRGLRWINWISGGIIIGFGLFALFVPAWKA